MTTEHRAATYSSPASPTAPVAGAAAGLAPTSLPQEVLLLPEVLRTATSLLGGHCFYHRLSPFLH